MASYEDSRNGDEARMSSAISISVTSAVSAVSVPSASSGPDSRGWWTGHIPVDWTETGHRLGMERPAVHHG